MNSGSRNDYESLVNDVSLQMASSQLSRRNSRSSKRHSGTPSRRSIRVEKPPTAQSSPRVLERRKTTTSVKQFTSLDDHYNAMFGSPKPEERTTATNFDKNGIRPMSWHPSASTATRAGLDKALGNRRSANIPNIPVSYSSSDPDYETTAVDQGNAFEGENTGPDMILTEDIENFDVALWSRYATTSAWPLMANVNPCLASNLALFTDNAQDWSFAASGSAPPTESAAAQAPPDTHMDFLPIQNPAALQDPMQPTLRSQRSKDSSKSLIGMGLYDPPEPAADTWRIHMDGYQTWLTPELVENTGKGLKLEETFEPPPGHGEDYEEEEDDDDNGSLEDEVQDELPVMDEPRLHVTVASSQPTNLAGQSFFFDDEESYSNEWWYGQTKNVIAPDAAMDCGWI